MKEAGLPNMVRVRIRHGLDLAYDSRCGLKGALYVGDVVYRVCTTAAGPFSLSAVELYCD